MKKLLIIFLLTIFLFSCSKEKYEEITKNPEASGICYMQNLGHFFVVGDEGDIFEIDKNGYIQSQKHIGDYDLESVICDEKNQKLFTINEKTGGILEISLKNNFEILNTFKINGYKLNKKGIEGFTKITDNKFIISTQTKKQNLLFLIFKNNKFIVDKIIDFPENDLSGLEYKNGILYIVSDKNDKIYKYNLEKEKVIGEIKLSKGAWEGISFDEDNNIFLADDNGKVMKMNN